MGRLIGGEMKIKGDFVTNSSSTSFVAWGIRMEPNEFKKKYGENIFSSEHVILGPDIVNESREEFFGDEFLWKAQNIILKKGLQCSHMEYGDFMVGLSPFKMKGDETADQFKKRVVETFKEINIELTVNDLVAIEEGWRDG